jgi:hypothetical protein
MAKKELYHTKTNQNQAAHRHGSGLESQENSKFQEGQST